MSNEIILRNKLKDNGIDEKYYDYLFKYLIDKDKIEEAIMELINGRPIQYIVGNVEFYNSVINVNESVLIPRFETELLVDKLIKYCKNKFDGKINALDMCTGSGCIAISLKKELNCDMTAVDISTDALLVARENCISNNVDVELIESDLFNNVDGKYNVIVSNPPYISITEDIMDIVKNNEPNIALYADSDGLYFYEEILKNASNYLNEKSMIAFEIGQSQGEKIKKLVNKYLPNSKILLEKDMQNRDRFIFVFLG